MSQRIMCIYFKQLGGHTHMRVFTGKEGFTLGKAGDLCFTNEEFRELRKREPPETQEGRNIRIEFVEEAS
jgi:hypothetical protein